MMNKGEISMKRTFKTAWMVSCLMVVCGLVAAEDRDVGGIEAAEIIIEGMIVEIYIFPTHYWTKPLRGVSTKSACTGPK